MSRDLLFDRIETAAECYGFQELNKVHRIPSHHYGDNNIVKKTDPNYKRSDVPRVFFLAFSI